jgi:hypothetical protein
VEAIQEHLRDDFPESEEDNEDDDKEKP